jgi:hypothetical protein
MNYNMMQKVLISKIPSQAKGVHFLYLCHLQMFYQFISLFNSLVTLPAREITLFQNHNKRKRKKGILCALY